MENFKDLKAGDKVLRVLAGKEIPMVVVHVKNSVITVAPDKDSEAIREQLQKGAEVVRLMSLDMNRIYEPDENVPYWTFSSTTGGEIDVELGYDGIYTCSFLKRANALEGAETTEGE